MNHSSPALEELFPGLTADEQKMAEANFDRYLKLTLCIFERLELKGHPQAVTLTESIGTLPCTRSPEAPAPNHPKP